MSHDLEIRKGLVIPGAELRWRFEPSGGPGGQHANRSATRAVLSYDLAASPVVPDDLKTRMMERLGGRARGGVVTVSVDESRSQWRNRAIARRRMARLLRDASQQPSRPRRPSRPTAAARRRRLDAKRRRAETKRLRRPPDPE